MMTLVQAPTSGPRTQPLDTASQAAVVIVVLTIWVLFAWMVGSQARAKNYSFAKFFCLALVFSPFALSAALWVLPRGPEKPAPDGTSNS